MLFRLVIALVVLGVVSAAKRLRGEDLLSADTPENPALFARFAAHMFPHSNTTLSAKSLSSKMKFKDGKPMFQSTKKKVASRGSYFTTRKYRNGDCTGAVTEYSGVRMNSCVYTYHNDVKRAYSHQCIPGTDPNTIPHWLHFASNEWPDRWYEQYDHGEPQDCNFQNFQDRSADLQNEGNKCEVDTENIPYHGFQMQSASCGESIPFFDEMGPGLFTFYSSFPGCGVDPVEPAAFQFIPFNVCQQYIDHSRNSDLTVMDESTDFVYYKMTSCDFDGHVSMHAYTDPACNHKLYRGTIDLNQHPMYHRCNPDPKFDMTGTMMCTRPVPPANW